MLHNSDNLNENHSHLCSSPAPGRRKIDFKFLPELLLSYFGSIGNLIFHIELDFIDRLYCRHHSAVKSHCSSAKYCEDVRCVIEPFALC